MKTPKLERRRVLIGAGATALSAVAALATRSANAAPAATPAWDHETDVVCVGSGAAACTAAITAVDAGAAVMLLEKLPLLGGTTGKSGGVIWIPNNFLLRQKSIVDSKEDCLRYMARYAYPETYHAGSPLLGLREEDYRLLETYYDNASPAIDKLRSTGAVSFNEFRLFHVDSPAPDYADHLPENKVPTGRCLQPAEPGLVPGGVLTTRMEAWLRAHKVPILTSTRVTRVIKEAGRVIGVEAVNKGKTIRIRARRGVIFGSGGFAHNTELCGLHQPMIYGSCAMPGSTGDFIGIAGEAGAKMGSLHTAWRGQVVLEEALQNRALGSVAFFLPGDSMVMVNKYGQRVLNEKQNYNDRTRTHFIYDPVREEYPNQLLFMVFDQRTLDTFGGSYPLPEDVREAPYLLQGETLTALYANIDARLKQLSARTGGFRLDPNFVKGTRESIARFNRYAGSGKDLEFRRGDHGYDREWHRYSSTPRAGVKHAKNKLPNNTMYPLADKGPYYAFIMAAGALDTNAGPQINVHAQVLDTHGNPIPGLYGAGNCIASPSRAAYFAAGGTIGAAVTYGYIAGTHAATSTESA